MLRRTSLLFVAAFALLPFALAQSPAADAVSDPAVPIPQLLVASGTPTDDPLQLASKEPPEVPEPQTLDDGFFHRFGRAYAADWVGHGPGTARPQEDRRGTPAPIPSPPYPAADWPIGGTVVIGAPDTQTYPFMQAVNKNKRPNKIYGWIEVGANGSTNNKSNASKGIAANAPAAYGVFSNTVQLDQAAVYFESLKTRPRQKHIDWGYRVALLYGTDYRFTTSHGILSQQLLVKNAEYGFDPVMFYYDIYLPHVAKGHVVRTGRYISLPDIEAQLAPNNYSYSPLDPLHLRLLYADGRQCNGQAERSLDRAGRLSPAVRHAALDDGCQARPGTSVWSTPGTKAATRSIPATTPSTTASTPTTTCTAFYETWYHRINPEWHTDTEAWYQYMKDDAQHVLVQRVATRELHRRLTLRRTVPMAR